MTLSIRRATFADAAIAVDITRRNFTEAFGSLYPPEDLAYFLANRYSLAEHQRMLADPAYALFLAQADGQLIGHALVGPCALPHGDVAAADGELKRLYLLPTAHNKGYGSALLQTALGWLEQHGPRTLWVGVWSQNEGAQRLYARLGFEKVGDYFFAVGATRDHEYILRRPAHGSNHAKV